MSRTKMTLGMLLVLAVGFVVGALASGGSQGGDVEAQLSELTKRVAALEKQISQLRASLPPSQETEQQAAAEYRKIDALLKAGKTTEAKTKLADFMKTYGQTQVGHQANRVAQELAVVGKESPADWGISKWFQGENDISLDGEGTTFVVFWETWCPHCQREVPKLEQIYSDYRGKGLKMIGVTKVTRSSTDQKVSEFISQQNVSYPIAKENGELTRYFNVAGIPAAAVVKDGKIVWRGHPARLTPQMLDNWL